MAAPYQVKFDTIRTVDHSGISASYAIVGTTLTHPARLISITNNTDGDMFFSTDGTNNMLFVAKNSYKLFDFCTNKRLYDDRFELAIGVQMYVKQSTAPTSGAVYLEVIYGE